MLALDKDRLHKLLVDAGIRLNVLVSNIHDQAGRAMDKAHIEYLEAAILLVEISPNMSSFGSAERLASWVGICPDINENAGRVNPQRKCLGAPLVVRICSSHRP